MRNNQRKNEVPTPVGYYITYRWAIVKDQGLRSRATAAEAAESNGYYGGTLRSTATRYESFRDEAHDNLSWYVACTLYSGAVNVEQSAQLWLTDVATVE